MLTNKFTFPSVDARTLLPARCPKRAPRKAAGCNKFLLGSIVAASCVLGVIGTPAAAAVKGDPQGSSQLSPPIAAAALKALHAAKPYEPQDSTLECGSKIAPSGVIAALDRSQLRGLHLLAGIIATCDRTGNLLQALTNAGGLTNPEVQGLNAAGSIDYALQAGDDVTVARIEATVGKYSKDLAALMLAERQAEDP